MMPFVAKKEKLLIHLLKDVLLFSSDDVKDSTIIQLSSMSSTGQCNKPPCLEEYWDEEQESTSLTTGDGSKSNESRI